MKDIQLIGKHHKQQELNTISCLYPIRIRILWIWSMKRRIQIRSIRVFLVHVELRMMNNEYHDDCFVYHFLRDLLFRNSRKKNNSLGKKEKEIETAIYSFYFLLFSRIINDQPFIHLQYLTAIDHTRILH